MNLLLILANGRWKLPLIMLLIFGSGLWLDHNGYQRGVKMARQQCQEMQIRAAATAAMHAQQQQTVRDTAETNSAQRAQDFSLARAPQSQKVTRYVQSPAARQPCLDAGGVRLGSTTIATANAALAAR